MDNFQAIGQLVTEARNLLDAIKGGAIRQMEVAFESIKQTVNSEWSAIKSKANSDLSAVIGRVDNETAINALGFTALNYNGDFMDTRELSANVHGHKNVFPIGMGVASTRNDCFKTEIIKVRSGSELDSRNEDVKTLLDFMNIGRDREHFSGSFNILKMTVLDTAFMDISSYDFFIPDQHIKQSPTATFMCYVKTEGDLSLSWLGNTGGEWARRVSHRRSDNAGSYTHVDLNFSNASVGDVVYIALPTICVGHFPASKKHGLLYNPKTELIRKVNSLHE